MRFTLLALAKLESPAQRWNSACYVEVASKACMRFRASIKLGAKDLHITLGFRLTDLHGEERRIARRRILWGAGVRPSRS